MNVLVIGGGGYLGRIVNKAIESAHQVAYLDLKPVPGAEDRTFVGDLADDGLVTRALTGQQAVLFMAMGQKPGEPRTVDTIDPAFNVNVRDQYRVLSIGLAQGVRHFSHVSSMSVYYPQHRKGRTDETAAPTSFKPYGLSKRLAEYIHAAAAQECPEGTFISLRMNYPRNEEDFKGDYTWNSAKGIENICGTGPEDTRRLMVAALNFKTPGHHIFQTTGDLEDIRFPNTKARELLGWSPEGK